MKTLLKISAAAAIAAGSLSSMMGEISIGAHFFGAAKKLTVDAVGKDALKSVGWAIAAATNDDIDTLPNANTNPKGAQTTGTYATDIDATQYHTPWGVGACVGWAMPVSNTLMVGVSGAFDFFFQDAAKTKVVYSTETSTYTLPNANGITVAAAAATAASAVANQLAGYNQVVGAPSLKNGKGVAVQSSWMARLYLEGMHTSGFGLFAGVHWQRVKGAYDDGSALKALDKATNVLSVAFGASCMSRITSNICGFAKVGWAIQMTGKEIDFGDNAKFATTNGSIKRHLHTAAAAAADDDIVLLQVTQPTLTNVGKKSISGNGMFACAGVAFNF